MLPANIHCTAVVAFQSGKEWTDPNWVVAAADHETIKSQFAEWSPTAKKIIGLM